MKYANYTMTYNTSYDVKRQNLTMCHSWERIASFAPWVTHGIELRAFIVRKIPKSMYNMWPYIGRNGQNSHPR